MSEIEYFYSAHSAFAYLGSNRFMEIAKAAGRTIVHKPYDLTRGIAGVGAAEPPRLLFPPRDRPMGRTPERPGNRRISRISLERYDLGQWDADRGNTSKR